MLRAVARKAAPPVFVVACGAHRAAGERLRLDPRLRVVESPRHAMLLIVVGELDRSLQQPLHRLHDALPHPRATLCWSRNGETAPPLPARRVAADGDVAAVCVEVAAGLLTGAQPSEGPLLPDAERHPWRGIGPYGQGGSGMTGGHPYGRALASRADDLRDRLTLDAVPVTVGPFFPSLPTGLTVRVTFQGDVVQAFEVVDLAPPPASDDDAFSRALREPTSVRALELGRASSHLLWLAGALRLLGLPALSERSLRVSLWPEPAPVRRLLRLTSRVVPLVTRDVGVLPPHALTGHQLGPVARASGIIEDARSDDPAYRALGFEPVVQRRGDVWARWRQRLDEIEQSLALAAAAGERVTGGDGRPIEGPHGAVGCDQLAPLLAGLPSWLAGMEWGDAVATLTSLDLGSRAVRAARASVV